MGPERRGYHTSVVSNGTLYIHGGHDIKVGTLDNIWSLDLTKINSLKKTMEIQKQKHASEFQFGNGTTRSVLSSQTIMDAPESDFGWKVLETSIKNAPKQASHLTLQSG